jgi:SnoaL-like domain
MTRDDVQRWLDDYIAAWLSYDAVDIGELFSEEAEYRYHPWDDPLVGRDAIVSDWLGDRDVEGTYSAHYTPFAVEGDRAVAVGESRYTNPDGSHRTLYHNVYLLHFDADGRCSSFTELFMELPEGRRSEA